MRAFVFIESNTTGTGRLFVEAARGLGLRPVLFTADPARYRFVGACGVETVVADTGDAAALPARVREFASGTPVAGVWSSSEYYVGRAALVAASLGLPGPDAAAIEACRNKAAQRARLAALGIDAWPGAIATGAAEAVAAARRLGYPVVVKPIAGSGSVGVRQCAGADEVRAQAARIEAAVLSAVATDRRMLVEKPVPGTQYSVELFGRHVVGITRQHYGPLPHFVAVGHDHPACLAADDAAAIGRFALDAAAALGLAWGPLHVELRFDHPARRAHLIEVNPRLAGGNVPELVRHATGIDLVRATVEAALGLEPDLAPRQSLFASLRFVLARGGRFDRMPAPAALEADRRIRDLALYRSPGDALEPVGDFHDRIGHVIAAGADAPGAAAAAEAAAARVARELTLAAA
ncbi:MAG: ATP-grasp domain-containing protein [Alphaproteobacteria bacterium]|nr:ATP-grasp domain-containing protein [Alphaproteobacteria bacterium]